MTFQNFRELLISLSLTKKIFFAQIVIFIFLLAVGYTGSSIGALDNLGLFKTDYKLVLGDVKPIRSDEWAVGTPLAISQFKHNGFNEVNRLIGIDGTNNAICHDVGVPTLGFYLIAKPATIGFFIFNNDLRRALSWYWIVPLFISINGVWLLLLVLFKKHSFFCFLIAMAYAFCPDNTGWSMWPSYQGGLAGATTAFFLLLFNSSKNSIYYKLLFTVLLSICASSLALTLYLPRIIPIVSFLSILVVGYFIQNYRNIQIKTNLVYVVLAAACTGIIISSWYFSNSSAIAEVVNSAYPGKRRWYGGGLTIFNLIQGWLTYITLHDNKGFLNPCELTGPLILTLPIFIIFFYAVYKKKIDYIGIAVIVYLIYIHLYLFVPLPEIIGNLTLWNRTTPYRSLGSIDFVQTVFFAWLIYVNFPASNKKTILAVITSLIFSYAVFRLFIVYTPDLLRDNVIINNIIDYKIFSNEVFYGKKFILCMLFVAITSFLLIYNIKYFVVFYACLILYISGLWNPVAIAPSKIEPLFNTSLLEGSPKHNDSILLDADLSFVNANYLTSIGLHSFCATQHYTSGLTYKAIYQKYGERFRAFHHTFFYINNSDSKEPKVQAIGDYFRWDVSGLQFDFSTLPVDHVLASSKKQYMKKNVSLKYRGEDEKFLYFDVNHKE